MNHFTFDRIFHSRYALDEEISKLQTAGYSTVSFSTDLGDKKEIFEFAKRNFFMDPALIGTDNWDALSDSIGGGMELIRSRGIVIAIDGTLTRKTKKTAPMHEFIDILFQIKRDQSLEKMKIYLYRCTKE